MPRSVLALWGIVLVAVVSAAVVVRDAPYAAPVIPAQPAPVPTTDTSLPHVEPEMKDTRATETRNATTYAFVTENAGTVEEAMRHEQERGLVFTAKHYPALGSFVESINGKPNASGSYWMLYINGTLSSLGMSQATVAEGDRIEWRYE